MTRPLSSDPCLTLTGDNLTVADAAHILHGQIAELRVAPAARRRVEQARRCLHDLLEQGATLYGVNTGFGKLANQRIEAARGARPAGEPAPQSRRRHGAAARVLASAGWPWPCASRRWPRVTPASRRS